MGLNLLGPVRIGNNGISKLTASPPVVTKQFSDMPVATIATAGNATITAANLATGVVLRDPNGAARSDTLDTAANIASALGLANLGDTATLIIRNTGESAESLTISGGAGNVYSRAVFCQAGAFIALQIVRFTPSTSAAVLGIIPLETGLVYSNRLVTTLATAGAGTYTAAALLGGFIARDPAGSARTDTTATGAQLDAAASNLAPGGFFDVTVKNTADASELITLAGGSGVTLIGTITVAQNETAVLRFVKTAAATYDVIKLG